MNCNSNKTVPGVNLTTGEFFPGTKAVIFAKKGMANKAMINNMKTGNIEKLKKQITKGTVIVINNPNIKS